MSGTTNTAAGGQGHQYAGAEQVSHTPTPWATWDLQGDDEYPLPQKGDLRLIGPNKICMGIIFGGFNSHSQELRELDGNAAFIVRACNAHDELLEALKALVADCMASDFNEHWDSFKNAELAISKAEGR